VSFFIAALDFMTLPHFMENYGSSHKGKDESVMDDLPWQWQLFKIGISNCSAI
jgi:hypothetical protein